jgi:cyclopropane fatty-acyl-phospholipid synthase-like methyltransferase
VNFIFYDLVIDWSNIKPKDLVLDVGCGNGALVNYLNKNKLCIAFGIDINKK